MAIKDAVTTRDVVTTGVTGEAVGTEVAEVTVASEAVVVVTTAVGADLAQPHKSSRVLLANPLTSSQITLSSH